MRLFVNELMLLSFPPHFSRDLEHGPGAGSGILPRLPPPTCSRPVSGVGLGLLSCGFLAAVSRPLLSVYFSLCDLRVFVNKRMLLSVCGPVLYEAFHYISLARKRRGLPKACTRLSAGQVATRSLEAAGSELQRRTGVRSMPQLPMP